MSGGHESEFEMQGEFAGFVRDDRGKRRMRLRIGEEEFFLKLPAPMRKQFEEDLIVGRAVVVSGVEERHRISGWVKRVISRLRFLEEPAVCSHCPIRVCAKKNCWKNGGKELWQTLEQQIEGAGLAGVLKLKAVGCLDHCKQAPNLACGATHLERCTPKLAADLIERLARDLAA